MSTPEPVAHATRSPSTRASTAASTPRSAVRTATPAAAAVLRRLRGDLLAPTLAVLALLLWLLGLHPLAPAQIGSIGLIGALSPVLLCSYPILVAAAVLELRAAAPRPRLLAAFTALGVLLVYGLQPATEQTARLSVAWLHTGFARYIADHGHALNGFDARFSWPGFFSLTALLTGSSGTPDATGLLRFAPVVLAGLAVTGVHALATATFGADRRAWFATWLFLLTEWTEQDYFSPQAISYVLMLAALALTVRYLIRPSPISAARRKARFERYHQLVAEAGLPAAADQERAPLRGRLVPVNSPCQRLAAEGLVVLIAVALAPTHQLTPFMLAGLLMVMVACGRLWPNWLPWLVLVPAVVWFALGAKDFWQNHLALVAGSVGDISQSVNQGIGARFGGGDLARTLILLLRVGITAAAGALAATGWWVLRRRGMKSWLLPLLAIAPFGLIALQSYGGEIFMRCYLFALPFAALLGAATLDAVLDTPRLPRTARLLLVGAILTGLGLATVAARGGNDAYTSFSRADLAAIGDAYRLAAPGQTIAGLQSDALPLGSADIGVVNQTSMQSTCQDFTHITQCVTTTAPDYLIVTPSEENYGRIEDGLPPGWTAQLVRDLSSGNAYQIVFNQDGSLVLARTTGTR
jgi:hypothetical protein